MRIVFWLPNAKEVFGGHFVQATKLSNALSELGVVSRVVTDDMITHAEWDFIVAIDLTLEQATTIPTSKLTILSIYWGFEYDSCYSQSFFRQPTLNNLRRHCSKSRRRLWGSVCPSSIDFSVFNCAGKVIANSNLEKRKLLTDGFVGDVGIVLNAHSVRYEDYKNCNRRRRQVVVAGRIEPYKNQATVIKAVKNQPFELLVIGDPHPHHREYWDYCNRIAGRNVYFIPKLSHDNLHRIMAQSLVCVVPSFSETCSLVGLDAVALGCNLVITRKGYTRDYFNQVARFVSPESIGDMRNQILCALNDNEENSSNYIRDVLTWENSAKQLISCLVK